MTKFNHLFMFILCFILLGAFGIPAAQGARPYEGQTLIVGSWSGPYARNFQAAFIKPFEKLTGAKLENKVSWDFTPEILAAPADDPPLDVTIAADGDYAVGIKNKLWLPIRYEYVPNAKNVFPILMNEISPNTKYGVPFDVGIHVLIYRKDLVKSPPTSWKDLWRDEFKGKIAIERWFPYWIYVGSYLTGYDTPIKAIYSKEGRDAILAAMKKLSKRWFFCYDKGAEFWAALDAGEILVGNYWNGSATAMVQEQIEKHGKATTYAMCLPKEGAAAYLDHYCVVRGTKKRDLAEAFINWIMSDYAQIGFLKKHYNLMTNKNVVPEIPAVMGDIHPRTDADWKKINFMDLKTLEPMRKELEERFMKEVLVQ